MRESPVNQGTVEFVEPANGRVLIRCQDDMYAGLKLASWARVSNGTRLFWSYTVAVNGVVFSEGGYRVEYEYAEWNMTRDDALAWFGAP
jgi:hypothetical protein